MYALTLQSEPSENIQVAYRPIEYVLLSARDTATDTPVENVICSVTITGGTKAGVYTTRAARRYGTTNIAGIEYVNWYFDLQNFSQDTLGSDFNTLNIGGPHSDPNSQEVIHARFMIEYYNADGYLVNTGVVTDSTDHLVINGCIQHREHQSMFDYYTPFFRKFFTKAPNARNDYGLTASQWIKYHAKPIGSNDSEYLSLYCDAVGVTPPEADLVISWYDKGGVFMADQTEVVDFAGTLKKSYGVGPANLLNSYSFSFPAGAAYYSVRLIGVNVGTANTEVRFYKLMSCPYEARLHWLNTLSDIDSFSISSKRDDKFSTSHKEFEKPNQYPWYGQDRYKERGASSLDSRGNRKIVLTESNLTKEYAEWLAEELMGSVEAYLQEDVNISGTPTPKYIPIQIESAKDQMIYSSSEPTYSLVITCTYANEHMYQRN